MTSLVKPLTSFFNLIHQGVLALGVHNLSFAYFLDIFIFTVIIRTILLPLTIKQTRSTVSMGKMQPKMKEIQAKYKNDPKKLNEKTMELYKEEGANPLAGCLLAIVQLPIFMAMYYVIYNFKGFDGVSFLWVKSLAQSDKTFILPIISGATTYFAGIMMAPKGDDPAAKQQKQMNIFMSLFFVYMSYKFRAALVLYWIISNTIQLAQQYFIIGKIRKKEEAKLVK